MRQILVFARAPLPGHCKTRLIASCGAIGAARLYRQLLERTLSVAAASGVGRLTICATPDARHPVFLRWRLAPGVSVRNQRQGDLGQRMTRALREALEGGATAVVIVGSDGPDLRRDDFDAAFEALERGADVFLLPAEDGGYILIAARAAFGTRLRGIAWSSGAEAKQTLSRLHRAGRQVVLGRLSWDVDDAKDTRRALRAGLLKRFGH